MNCERNLKKHARNQAPDKVSDIKMNNSHDVLSDVDDVEDEAHIPCPNRFNKEDEKRTKTSQTRKNSAK